MPNGNVFDGFSRIQDDLRRTYVSVGGGHRLSDDTSLKVFAPIDFPFDHNHPSRVTLICEAREDRPDVAPVLVGTIDLTQWDRDVPCPDLFSQHGRGSVSLKVALAYKLNRAEHADRLARLLQVIPGWTEQPENEQLLRFWMSMARSRKDYEEAVRIGQVLTPILLGKPRGQSRYDFQEPIVALAATGRLHEAKVLVARIAEIEEMDPQKSDVRYATLLDILIRSLARDAELTMDQISQVLGFDISEHDEYRRAAEQARQDVAFRKSKEKAERRMEELGAYYRTHPLPEKAELVERPDDTLIYLAGTGNDLPGHPGYKILPINTSVSGIVSILKHIVGGDKGEASLVHPHKAAIRFADGLEDRELRADLVYKDSVEEAERFHLVLTSLGMEVTHETRPAPAILIAKYDGRKFRNYLEVRGPWHVDSGGSGLRVWHMADLLEQLSRQMQAGVFILDQTGIGEPVCVGTGTPQWQGAGGIEQARRWLQEQFGVTFTEETRSITTYLVQRRAR